MKCCSATHLAPAPNHGVMESTQSSRIEASSCPCRQRRPDAPALPPVLQLAHLHQAVAVHRGLPSVARSALIELLKLSLNVMLEVFPHKRLSCNFNGGRRCWGLRRGLHFVIRKVKPATPCYHQPAALEALPRFQNHVFNALDVVKEAEPDRKFVMQACPLPALHHFSSQCLCLLPLPQSSYQ